MRVEKADLGPEEWPDYADGEQSVALKRLQNVQLEILDAFSGHCAKHGLQYFLITGSALGAKRHGGMIPWDDDIDVGMLRTDYDRLVATMVSQPLKGLFFQTYATDPQMLVSYAKLRKHETAFHERLLEELDAHKGVFIDIVPYDNAFASPLLRRLQCLCLSPLHVINSSATRQICRVAPNPLIRAIRHMFYFVRPILPINLVRRLQERIMRLAGAPKGADDLVGCFDIYNHRKYEKTLISRSKLVPTEDVRFDHLMQPVPRDIDAHLFQIFGNYMQLPEPKNRKPAHGEAVQFGNERNDVI